MTTPTPDKGALERARAAARSYLDSIEGHLNPEDHAANHFLEFAKHERGAAASEARAAAIAQACRLCALEAVRANDRAVHAKPFSRETTEVWCATARELEDRIAARATPAQSEEK